MTTDRDGRVLRLPTGEQITALASGVDNGGTAFEVEALLPPHLSGPPRHRHRYETEVFTVLDGVLRVRLGRETQTLVAGESVTVLPGTVHAFANPSSRPTRIRTLETPAGPLEEQFRAVAAGGRLPPIGRLARITVDSGYSFALAGIPDRIQQPLWRLLATLDTGGR
jgi:quercetin dioxygenase-like cupin family protein